MNAVIVVGATYNLLGCHADYAGAPVNTAATVALGPGVASPLNSVIAVGDTISVTLKANTLSGTPITAFDSLRYILENVTDTQYVQVSQFGAVTGRAPTGYLSPVHLWMVGFKGHSWAADEALITVTQTKMAHPILELLPGGVHYTAADGYLNLQSQSIVDADGVLPSVPGMLFRLEFRSQDSALVSCWYESFSIVNNNGVQIDNAAAQNRCGSASGYSYGSNDTYFYITQTGTIELYANAMVYGKLLHDSVVVANGNAQDQTIYLQQTTLIGGSTYAMNRAISPGGTIVFYDLADPSYGLSIDIVFDHPEAATAWPDTAGAPTGNIVGLTWRQRVMRQFKTPGTYGFTAKVTAGLPPLNGATRRGTITVQ